MGSTRAKRQIGLMGSSRARERIGLAVKFAQRDLSELTETDLQQLRGDLNEIIGSGTKFVFTGNASLSPQLGSPSPSQFTAEDFRSLQREIRGILGNFTQAGSGNLAVTEIKAGYTIVNADFAGFPDRSFVQVRGSGRDLALLALLTLLSLASVPYVLRCPECGTIFVRVRRQKYCSRRCASNANFRAWSATNRERVRAAARKAARKRYEKTTRARFGQKVRIAERPRTQPQSG
jgi:endogenous inhibitor of DNA gyrase (YacG/DUF329 family)